MADTINVGPGTIGARLTKLAAGIPHGIAIVERDTQVTFAQLDEAATAIARQLLSIVHDRPGCVCLFFESKLTALLSVFGAGNAGRTYVAVDAGDPEERLRFILDDCEPVALLTEARLLDRARTLAPAGCAVVDVARRPDGDGARPLPEVASDALAYLCYTSGSTGRPKGVGQTHRNLLFFADAYAKGLSIGENDRLSLLYTLSFNAVNMDIFGGLLNGATLCAYDTRRDGIPSLANWLDRQRITVLHTVPTIFREMGKRLAPARVLPYLRVVDLGGESVFAGDIELFRAHTKDHCVLINQLASTEVGLIAQYVAGHRGALPGAAIVPVGRCPDGVRVTIRRPDGSLAEVNEVGEMIVSSVHVSPGYWRRPELDAAAFAADPQDPRWRQYASGDFGRIDADGSLHFIGRKAGRVKIRGHSVDLMEVEAAVSACPGVMKVAVLATRSERQGEPDKLIAYIVTSDDTVRDPRGLRGNLANRLPSYMLPAGFVFLDALPSTASGKVDRAALATMQPVSSDPAREVDAPSDEVERQVAIVFEQLLNVAPIGRDDDFFLLGGDSLLATELQLRLRDTLGVAVGSFHMDATVAGIGRIVGSARAAPKAAREAFPVMFPLWQQGSEPPMFLIHGRHGQAFVSPHFMQLLGNNQPVWAFQARGLDGSTAPHASVEDMADDYLAELRKRRPHGPYFIAALCAGALIAGAMARRLCQAGESVLPLLLFDPPDRLMQDGYSQMPEQAFVSKMKSRGAMGRTEGPVNDPAYMKAVVRVAMAFEQAIANYRPQPYDGPVLMLSSRQRIEANDPVGLRKVFSGSIDRHEVGTTHHDALDPQNPVFARALLDCIGRIRVIAQENASTAGRPETHDQF